MPARKRDSHKGDNGRVLVISGSEEYSGAPALVSVAALRGGADLAILAAPEKTAYAVTAYSPDVITKKLPGRFLQMEHLPTIYDLAVKADSVVIGPGLGKMEETLRAVRAICEHVNKPKVIDADAITARPPLSNCVVTPHSREFERLYGKKPTPENVKKKAARDRVILSKAMVDVVSDGKRVVKVKGGNAGMTHGGTGDVLSGLVGSFIAQGMPMFDAAVLASRVNKKAGEMLAKKMGFGYLASDLTWEIPSAMMALKAWKVR
jgi:NAD(P)H-hydrate epimerase